MDHHRSLDARADASSGVASRLVPRRLRDEWRREWEGELRPRRRTPIGHACVRHALGSFVDAFWIRQRDVADLQDDRRSASWPAAVDAAIGVCDHRRRHPGAEHRRVGHGLQRRVADPAAAASLSRIPIAS